MQRGDRIGPYELVCPLGQGGMGVVWEAVDTRLQRGVALKFLPEGVADDPETRLRFEREARAVSALSHPNICVLYDIGELDGRPYLVMELLRGAALNDVLAAGRLAEPELRRAALQLARALDAAHDRGILHRDLKPANIFRLQSGDTKILDFGVAKVAGAEADDATELTAAGTMMGTVKYMSPEQALGQPLDARSDLFSLGAVLFEAATGQPPFNQSTAGALLNAVVNDDSVALRAGEGVSEEFAAIVNRLLAKSPGDRYPSAAHLASDLERSAAVPHGGSNAAVTPSRAADASASIAVLPFKNFSVDPDTDFFSDGLAEELTTGLSRVDGLRVAARSSTARVSQQQLDAGDAGAQLGVSSVLEGSVRRAGNRVRVAVQLIDVASGFQTWADRYDGDLEDIFQIQEEMATAIVEQLEVKLGASGPKQVLRRHTRNASAYEMYLRGRFHWERRHRGEQARALECFKSAVAIDPEYALAYVGIADCHWTNLAYAAAPAQGLREAARAALDRALELAPDLVEARASEAIMATIECDWSRADRLYNEVLSARPDYWLAFAYRAMQDAVLWRLPEMRQGADRVIELEPDSAFAWALAGFASCFGGDYEVARERAARAVALDPSAVLAHMVAGMTAAEMELHPEAVAHFEQCVQLTLRTPMFVGMLACAVGRGGDRDRAQRLLQELERRAADDYVMDVAFGMAWLGLGDRDEAHRHYRQAVITERPPAWTFCMFARPFPDLLELLDVPPPPADQS